MIIPGFIITWITFPGVIVHEFAHKLFCQLTGTKVLQVKYFRFGNPAGYVIHEVPSSTWRHILIGIGPLFVNTSVGLLLGLLCFSMKAHEIDDAFLVPLLWLSVSIAMHSFPSRGDAKAIWNAIWHSRAPITAKVVGTPLVALIFVGAIGSIFWLDLAYGYGVVVGLPEYFHSS
jgi:hypothetical protein